jgi:hypothetical protein
MGETAEYAVIAGSFSHKQNDFFNLSKYLEIINIIGLKKYNNVLNVFHVGCLINKKEVNLTVSNFRINFKGSSGEIPSIIFFLAWVFKRRADSIFSVFETYHDSCQKQVSIFCMQNDFNI